VIQRRFSRLTLLIVVAMLCGLSGARQSAHAQRQRSQSAAARAQSISANDSIELLGNFGGRLKVLAVNGSWLYAAHSGGFVVVDASNPSQSVRSGYLPLPFVAKVGDYANGMLYLATNKAVYAIDVSDPEQPTIRSSYSLSSDVVVTPLDLDVVDDRLYLLYHNPKEDILGNQIRIFDVSDPQELKPLGTSGEELWPDMYEMVIVGSFAYITLATSGLALFDVSDPSHPKFHSKTTVFGRVFDIAHAGNTLYLGTLDQRLLSVDISDPGNPTLIGEYTAPDFAVTDLVVQNDRAYVANQVFPNPYDLRILDVSDPTDLRLLGSYATDLTQIHTLLVSDNLVYLNAGQNTWEHTVQIVDVSNPASPVSRHRMPRLYSAEDVDVVGTTAYIAAREDGFFVLDVADPSQPRLRATRRAANGEELLKAVMKLQVVGNLAYLASNNALQIVDVTDPDNPSLRGELPIRAFQLQVAGNRAYVMGSDTFHIVDVSDPTQPNTIGSRSLSLWYPQTEDLHIVGNLAYLSGGSCAAGCWGSIKILDISNPTQLTLIGSIDGPFGDVELRGNLLYITKQYTWIYDVSNPAAPTLHSVHGGSYSPDELEIVAGRAYFSGGFFGGIQIADLSGTDRPRIRASYRTAMLPFESRRTDLKVVNDLVYLADGYNGLQILRVDPAAFPSSIFAPIIGK
jgi:hypothetical protein